jgi:hypothetical protein
MIRRNIGVLTAAAVTGIIMMYAVMTMPAAGQSCIPVDQFNFEKAPGYQSHRVLSPMGAAAAMDWINSQPPPTAWQATTVALIWAKGGGGFAVFGVDDSICGGVYLSPADFYEIERRVMGNVVARGLTLVQHHSHPPRDAELHEQFYSTWNMPNGGKERITSCCNKHDCYPTQFRQRNGRWQFLRREDQQWVSIPDGLMEHEQSDPRESPDGQSHVCAPPSGRPYCAAAGSGI